MKIGYHCSHEQFSPRQLLNYAIKAEKVGFHHLSCSDHFAPWTDAQGESGNAWCWMGSILAMTKVTCGTVCAPGYRYHPAIIAQMAATLSDMFPRRFWLALGSGEYLNEQFTGISWPIKNVRNERLKECAIIIRDLLDGKEVTRHHLIPIETAKLYSLPQHPVSLWGAALSPESASHIQDFTNGLITAGPFDQVKEVVTAYKKSGKPCMLKLDVSYAQSRDKAIALGWEQWKHVLLGGSILAELRYPQHFEQASQFLNKDQFVEQVVIATTPSDIETAIYRFKDLGFEQINLHNVNKEQEPFIEAVGLLLKDGNI
jgi:coenzyme F420-dependent glucose-6-phosphate dehydrogenase